MKTEQREGKLFLALEGRIDSANAPEFEREASDALAQNPGMEPAFDAAALDYISSAGLRVLMKFRKAAGKPLTLENASPEVYDILETTGFTDLLNVRKRLREISVDGCELLGEGANGAVYRLDADTIVKVCKPWIRFEDIDRERQFARTAFVNGVPCVIPYDTVRVGNRFGIVFEMLKSDTLGRVMRAHPEKLEEYVDRCVALAKTLHNTHVKPGVFADIREVLHTRVPPLAQWCTKEELSLLDSLIDSIPDSDTLVHNDLHPGNIMIQDGELVLIDMDRMTMGPPVCDLIADYRALVFAPRISPEVMVRSSGLPAETLIKVGDMFFSKYAGISGAAELEAYYKKLHLLYAFDITLMLGAGVESALQRRPDILQHLFREEVVPNEKEIRYLFANL